MSRRVGPPFGIDGIAPSPEGQGRKSRCPDVATRGRARRRTSKRTEAVDSHLRARSSVGQSRGLIIPWSQVRVLPGPRGESLSRRAPCSVDDGVSGSQRPSCPSVVRLSAAHGAVETVCDGPALTAGGVRCHAAFRSVGNGRLRNGTRRRRWLHLFVENGEDLDGDVESAWIDHANAPPVIAGARHEPYGKRNSTTGDSRHDEPRRCSGSRI